MVLAAAAAAGAVNDTPPAPGLSVSDFPVVFEPPAPNVNPPLNGAADVVLKPVVPPVAGLLPSLSGFLSKAEASRPGGGGGCTRWFNRFTGLLDTELKTTARRRCGGRFRFICCGAWVTRGDV